jgi:hypothetical protein
MIRGCAAFAVTLGLLIGVGLFYERDVRDRTAGGTLPTLESMGPDWYIAVDDDLIHWDHYIHYAGYGSAIESA